jgi:hypothetical protein
MSHTSSELGGIDATPCFDSTKRRVLTLFLRRWNNSTGWKQKHLKARLLEFLASFQSFISADIYACAFIFERHKQQIFYLNSRLLGRPRLALFPALTTSSMLPDSYDDGSLRKTYLTTAASW